MVMILGDDLQSIVIHRLGRAVTRFILMKKFTIACAMGHIFCDLLWLLIDNGFWPASIEAIRGVAIVSRLFAIGFVASVAWFIAKKYPDRDPQTGG